MFGPGKYVPDPTEGIIDVQDLPAPQIVAYDRHIPLNLVVGRCRRTPIAA